MGKREDLRKKRNRSDYHREYARGRVAYSRKYTSDFRKKKRAFVDAYLSKHPCACGETDITVLEFDHRKRSEKKFLISYAVQDNTSFAKLEEEINKCDVRCANCHRRKTAKERDWLPMKQDAAFPSPSPQLDLFERIT